MSHSLLNSSSGMSILVSASQSDHARLMVVDPKSSQESRACCASNCRRWHSSVRAGAEARPRCILAPSRGHHRAAMPDRTACAAPTARAQPQPTPVISSRAALAAREPAFPTTSRLFDVAAHALAAQKGLGRRSERRRSCPGGFAVVALATRRHAREPRLTSSIALGEGRGGAPVAMKAQGRTPGPDACSPTSILTVYLTARTWSADPRAVRNPKAVRCW